jgi:predicted transposase YdaD
MFEKHHKELVDNAKMEIAKNFLANGVDVETVAKSTGLTIDDVLRLKSQ